jgi:hypothetical protein
MKGANSLPRSSLCAASADPIINSKCYPTLPLPACHGEWRGNASRYCIRSGLCPRCCASICAGCTTVNQKPHLCRRICAQCDFQVPEPYRSSSATYLPALYRSVSVSIAHHINLIRLHLPLTCITPSTRSSFVYHKLDALQHARAFTVSRQLQNRRYHIIPLFTASGPRTSASITN